MKFKKIFDKVMELEGGLVLHQNPTEKAETYAGIYRAAHPTWAGWIYIDNLETPPVTLVEEFYKDNYWDAIKLDDVFYKAVIFEYGVNSGLSRAIKTAQAAVKVTEDGVLGPVTKAAIENVDQEMFLAMYGMERVKFYVNLVNKNKHKYGVYLRGWINRVVNINDWLKEIIK